MSDHTHRLPNTPEHPGHPETSPEQASFWKSKTGLITIVFLVIGAFFLVTEHRAHLLGWLPWLILPACLFLHLFMHGGHSGHAGHGRHSDAKPPQRPDDTIGTGD